MKHGKKLTLRQKQILNGLGLDPMDFLRVKISAYDFTVVNIHTGKIQDIRF